MAVKFDAGIAEFAIRMRQLARICPVELDEALVKIGKDIVIPASKAKAAAAFSGAPPHDGKAGHLADSTTVRATPRGAVIENKRVYANVQNWGGHTWHAQSRIGRSTKPKGRAIAGSHFISGAIYDEPENTEFIEAVDKALNELVQKFLA